MPTRQRLADTKIRLELMTDSSDSIPPTGEGSSLSNSEYWHTFWNKYPNDFDERDVYRQVGKTLGGRPIGPHQFSNRIADIVSGLDLRDDDRLLELCCGNGLITRELSSRCASVSAVDFSEPLIGVARARHQEPNVTYHVMSVLDIAELDSSESPFTKVLMYEALQHLRLRDVEQVLRDVRGLCTESPTIFFGSIPNADRNEKFWETVGAGISKTYREATGQRDPIGTWYRESELAEICTGLGLSGTRLPQSESLHTADYRFDFRIE